MSDSADPGAGADGPDLEEPDDYGPMQVDNPDYHHVNHPRPRRAGGRGTRYEGCS